MGKLRVYCLKTLNKLSIYPLGNTPSAPSDSGLQHGIPLLLARVVTNDPLMECSALVGVKVVVSQFAASHATDGMNKVATEQIFKSVLIWVVGVGTTVEVVSRRILSTFLVASVLRTRSVHVEQ